MNEILRAEKDWDELLLQHPPSIEAAEQRQQQLDLWMDGRPVCGVVRPQFVTREMMQTDARVSETVLSAIHKACDWLRRNPAMSELYLGPSLAMYGPLMDYQRGYSQECVFGRLDAYRTPKGLRFLEYNAGMAGGFTRGADLATYFEGLPSFAAFQDRHPVSHQAVMPRLLEALLEAWTDWGGQGQPDIVVLMPKAMLKLPAVVTTVQAALRYFSEQGVPARVVDPIELEFDGKFLRQGAEPVRMVLRAFLVELAGEGIKPLMQALKAGAVCMVNPFSLNGHKAVFDVLTDFSLELGYTAEERQVVEEHVPWTRLVRPTRTQGLDGSQVDLLDHALSNQHRLVLKAAVSLGGKDVMLGWRMPADEWRKALETAVSDRYWVVQDKLELVGSTFPQLATGFPPMQAHLDCCPLLIGGRFAGYMTRLSPGEITNVSSGGSSLPTFILESK